MQNLINKEVDTWIRPWDEEKPNTTNKDERYFSLLTKGVLEWLTTNIKMYGKPIKHFILNTGSAYLYLEKNGYEYTWCETTGEDNLYLEVPRCIVSMGAISIPMEELSNPHVRGVYERKSTAEKTNGQILAYNAEVRRLPIEITYNLKYVFSTFNESIIFVQEILEKILFQQYFRFVYLGQILDGSIEFTADTQIEVNKIDFTSNDVNQKTIEFDIKVCSNLPLIDSKTEALCANVIHKTKIPESGIFKRGSGEKLGDYKIKYGKE